MSDIEHKRKKAKELEEGNQRSYKELCEFAGKDLGMNTSDTRRETFIEMMAKWGIVTEEQMLDFEIEFHGRVEEALNAFHAQFREAQGPKLAVVKDKPSGLIGPDGRRLT